MTAELAHGDTLHGVVVPQPRYHDALTAAFMLRGAVKLWEAEGHGPTLDKYLRGGAPGERNPLGNLRQYRPFQAVVDDAAGVLMVGRQ